MGKLEQELNKLINENNLDFSYFLKKHLKPKLFGKKDKSEIIELLPTIIKHTSNKNASWVETIYIKDSKFLDTFIDNIDKFDFQNSDLILEKSFNNIFSFTKLTKEQLEKLITKVLECDCVLSSFTLESFIISIKSSHPELLESMLNKYLTNEKTYVACYRFISYNKEYLDLFYKHIDFFLEHNESNALFQLKEQLKDNKEVVAKIENKIETNKKSIVINTINEMYNGFLNNNWQAPIEEPDAQKKLDIILEIVYLIIEDICKNENIKVSELNLLNRGSFSQVLELGNKVLKIGYKRGTKTFPNNPYVVATLLRKDFPINDQTSFFLEVNEKVDTKTKITEEELYQLYKKIRNLKLIWSDVATRNVGRLLTDNQINWRFKLPITDERLGLQPFRGTETLKKGDIVILDNDLIFDENDEPSKINEFSTDLQKKFENRYQQERITNQNINMKEETATEDFSPKKR